PGVPNRIERDRRRIDRLLLDGCRITHECAGNGTDGAGRSSKGRPIYNEPLYIERSLSRKQIDACTAASDIPRERTAIDVRRNRICYPVDRNNAVDLPPTHDAVDLCK